MKDSIKYNYAIQLLRNYFQQQGYIEVPVQSRLSILAACEDPKTVSTFVFDGESWPLPQTGQMQLEFELLTRDIKGVYCISTSYRNEPQPIPGRHDKIFPMFEFEGRGDVTDLLNLERDLLEALNIFFSVSPVKYDDLCSFYGVSDLGVEHEEASKEDFGDGLFITNFPEKTSPFWNMKRNLDGTAAKIDIIINGMETIGSAERETDVNMMRNRFHSISGGEYAGLLYRHFGEDRVLKELDQYLSLPMIPRFGGGIGITRLVQALKVK